MKVTAKYGTVIIRICALHFTHLHTHTAVNTHTVVNTHTAVNTHTHSEHTHTHTHTVNTHTAVNTHTHTHTHTHREHTPGAVGRHLCCGARRAVGSSVPCSRATQSERALYIHSPPQSLPDRDSNSQPLDYESDSLPLGHDYSFIFQFHKETCSILFNNKSTHFIFIICLKSHSHFKSWIESWIEWIVTSL